MEFGEIDTEIIFQMDFEMNNAKYYIVMLLAAGVALALFFSDMSMQKCAEDGQRVCVDEVTLLFGAIRPIFFAIYSSLGLKHIGIGFSFFYMATSYLTLLTLFLNSLIKLIRRPDP